MALNAHQIQHTRRMIEQGLISKDECMKLLNLAIANNPQPNTSEFSPIDKMAFTVGSFEMSVIPDREQPVWEVAVDGHFLAGIDKVEIIANKGVAPRIRLTLADTYQTIQIPTPTETTQNAPKTPTEETGTI